MNRNVLAKLSLNNKHFSPWHPAKSNTIGIVVGKSFRFHTIGIFFISFYLVNSIRQRPTQGRRRDTFHQSFHTLLNAIGKDFPVSFHTETGGVSDTIIPTTSVMVRHNTSFELLFLYTMQNVRIARWRG